MNPIDMIIGGVVGIIFIYLIFWFWIQAIPKSSYSQKKSRPIRKKRKKSIGKSSQ